jgi:hypothetical protein
MNPRDFNQVNKGPMRVRTESRVFRFIPIIRDNPETRNQLCEL